jgi:hypothetical protein
MTINECKIEYEKRRKHEIISDNHSMNELFVFPHNPEVGGSSPLPATTKRGCNKAVLENPKASFIWKKMGEAFGIINKQC